MKAGFDSARAIILLLAALGSACGSPPRDVQPLWERDNPIKPIPAAPFGMDLYVESAKQQPTPERVRLGRGWNDRTRTFADVGRMAVSHDQRDRGAFKTPGLREVSRHPPYMHDGSIPTLRMVVEMYDRGGIQNPTRDAKIVPLGLTDTEINGLVEFLHALEGEGYQDVPPTMFPQ